MSRRSIPLRTDYNSKKLQALIKDCTVVKQYRRLRAIKAIYEGVSRTNAAKIADMNIDSLRFWVNRFNQLGPEGLINAKPTGRPTKLSKSKLQESVLNINVQNSKSNPGQLVRLADLQDYIKRTNNIDITVPALSIMLKREGISLQTAS